MDAAAQTDPHDIKALPHDEFYAKARAILRGVQTVIDGKREQFLGKLQERQGLARDAAEQQLKDWHSRNPDFRFND